MTAVDRQHQTTPAAKRMARTRERRRRGAFAVSFEISAEVVAALEDELGVDIETSEDAGNAAGRYLDLWASDDVARNLGDFPNLLSNHRKDSTC